MAEKSTHGAAVVPRQGTQLPVHITNPAPLPPELEGIIQLPEWFNSITKNVEYKEPNPEYMEQRMMLLTIMSATPEELLTPNDLKGLQDIIPDAPWQTTGNIILTSLYVAASDLKEGRRTYMLFSYVNEETGVETTTTTGATQLQLQICGLLMMGQWPIRGRITRTDKTDRAGRYLFWLFPPE